MKQLCEGAWSIRPTPLMKSMGNNYYICSKCGEPCAEDTDTPNMMRVTWNKDRLELDSILYEHITSFKAVSYEKLGDAIEAWKDDILRKRTTDLVDIESTDVNKLN